MTSQPDTATASQRGADPAAPRRRRRGGGRVGQTHPLVALLWLSPALALIFGVVVYPAIKLIEASRGDYSITGLRIGDAGWSNYADVLDHRAFLTVLGNTGIWVVTVVAFTIVISLALAQLLVQEFPGRRFVRWSIIVPWAASLIITSQLFVLLYDYNYGMINHVLTSVGLLETPIDFLGDDAWTMPAMIAVGILVSVPFTVFVFIAGLNSIPGEMMEAARVDGASAWQRYRLVTLPLMKSSMLVAAVLNVIYVFNSFPIVYTLNDRNPGFSTDTSITFMYKLAFESQAKDVGMSAAMGIMNVLLILAAIGVYLKVVDWKEETSQ